MMLVFKGCEGFSFFFVINSAALLNLLRVSCRLLIQMYTLKMHRQNNESSRAVGMNMLQ